MIRLPKQARLWRPHLWVPRLRFAPGYPCCCEDTCLWCTGGSEPAQFSVTLAGIVNNGCADCSYLNDTFILDHLANAAKPYQCNWEYVFSGGSCSAHDLQASVVLSGGNVYLNVTVWDDPASNSKSFQKNYGAVSDIDCQFSSVDVPYIGQNPWSSDCDFSSATCTISAV